MSDLVPSSEIERIVGVKRHATAHYARAVSAEETVYILHSQECFDSVPDLRQCPYSLALDNGIDLERWVEDVPVRIVIEDRRIIPLRGDSREATS